jgi:hypothetical protein
MRQELVPGLHPDRAAETANDLTDGLRRRELPQEILARARSPNCYWGTLGPAVLAILERKTEVRADLLQWSRPYAEEPKGWFLRRGPKERGEDRAVPPIRVKQLHESSPW